MQPRGRSACAQGVHDKRVQACLSHFFRNASLVYMHYYCCCCIQCQQHTHPTTHLQRVHPNPHTLVPFFINHSEILKMSISEATSILAVFREAKSTCDILRDTIMASSVCLVVA